MSMFKYDCDEVKNIIDEVSPNYPQLTTFEKEWLYFHKYGYIPGIPVNLEYATVETSDRATVLDAIPYSYKSAILKGNTDENLQSVKMPVLTSSGKNLFNVELEQGSINTNIGTLIETMSAIRSKDFIKLYSNETFTISKSNGTQIITVAIYNKNYKFVRALLEQTFTLTGDEMYVKIADAENDLNNQYQIEKGKTPSSYEPHKSNILTVNEDVTLRGIGEVKDELNLLTGELIQRIETRVYQEGDESNSDVITDLTNTVYKLTTESVKTVKLTDKLSKPYEGTNHYETYSDTIPPIMFLEVPVVSTGDMTLLDIQNQD